MSLIFDMDGTIIDAVPSILRSINQTLENLGYDPVGPEDIRLSGLPLRNILLSRLSEKELEEGMRMYRHIQYSTFQEDTRVFPGARELLEEWKSQGYKIGIFTLRSGATARQVLEAFDLQHVFDAVVGYDEALEPKPSPVHVETAASLLNVSSSDSLVVGDNPIDIISGREAGAKTVGVLWGMGSKKDMEDVMAWKTASVWSDLGNIVEHWQESMER